MRIGILGFGRIGKEHAGWISRISSAQIAGVFDPTPARLEIAQSMGLRAVRSERELLEDASIDVILVATPSSMHHDQAIAALDANKHVMVEKPLGVNLDQAVAIATKARQVDRKVCVFQNRRWDADFLTVKHAIESGVFGRVFNIESRLTQWASCVGPAAREYRPNWRNERAFGGGALLDWGSHFVDQILLLPLCDKPVQVFAQLRGNVWSNDCDDFARVCINFNSGVTAMIEINTTTTHPLPRWRVDGTKGSAQSALCTNYDTKIWSMMDFVSSDNPTRLPLKRFEMLEPEIQLWSKFFDSIQTGCEVPVPLYSVLGSMKIINGARVSSETCATIQL